MEVNGKLILAHNAFVKECMATFDKINEAIKNIPLKFKEEIQKDITNNLGNDTEEYIS